MKLTVGGSEHVYHVTSNGVRYRLGPTPSRLDELSGPDNPFKCPPRGKFERMQVQLDLPYHLYVVVRFPEIRDRQVQKGSMVEYERRVKLPMRVRCPDGNGWLAYSIAGTAGVVLDACPHVARPYPVDQVEPLEERFYDVPLFETWVKMRAEEVLDDESE